MDGLHMLYTRRSIRRFKDDPIERDILAKIIKAGHLAATARNIQPWQFVVIQDADLRRKIADMSTNGKFIADAPVCVAVFCEETKYYLEDGSAATENILLAARYFKIGSCWVAGDKKPYVDDVRKLCGLAEDHRLISLIALGYAQDANDFSEKPLKNLGFNQL
jgi:nitroreductase